MWYEVSYSNATIPYWICLTILHFITFNSHSTIMVYSKPCKLHDVNRCWCKVPSFPITPPICQRMMHVVTQPFDLSWARRYLTQTFEPDLSQMLAWHNHLIVSWAKCLFSTTIWVSLKLDACISTTVWSCVEPDLCINKMVWSCLEPDAYMNTTRWTCLESFANLMLTI